MHEYLITLQRLWWTYLLRGIFAILFGVMAIAWPATTFLVLAVFFAVYILFDGVGSLIAALGNGLNGQKEIYLLLRGVLGLGIAMIALSSPYLAELLLVLAIGIWAIGAGILELMAAWRIGRITPGGWMLIPAGIVSILLGGFILMLPAEGVKAWMWIIGILAMIFGLTLIVFSFQLKRADLQQLESAITRATEPQTDQTTES